MSSNTILWPGFHWLVSRWPEKDGPGGPYHWTAYKRVADGDPPAVEMHGTSATRDEAIHAAKAAVA